MVIDVDESSSGSGSGSDSDDVPVQHAAGDEVDDTPVWLRGRHIIPDELEDWLFENPSAAGTMVYRPFEEWCAIPLQSCVEQSYRASFVRCVSDFHTGFSVHAAGDLLATQKSLRHWPAVWLPINRSLVG